MKNRNNSIAAAILKVVHEAGCPVSSLKMHIFVGRELGITITQQEALEVTSELRQAKLLLRSGGLHGMVEAV